MINTKLSTVALQGQDQVEVVMHQRAHLDATGMAETLRSCQALGPHGALRILIELPVDADFNMTFMKKDHFKEAGMQSCTAALALATGNPFLERLMGLYFAYYPQPFPIRIHRTRAEALAWLQEAQENRGVA